MQPMLDDEQAYQALKSRDSRFDGWFFAGVTSTGVYCRASCPVVMPRRENLCFFPTAAAAQAAGYRACKRCRPDAAPGSPEWNVRADLVGRAMRLIADGLVDREGVAGLAASLGYSERQLHRQLVAEVGAGPQALARAQRAQTARLLLETTDLPVGEVAFAAGFASIRQFNDCVRQVFGRTPTGLRARATPSRDAPGRPSPAGTISLRLPCRPPIDLTGLLRFLAARAIPGVEECADGTYRRAMTLPHGGVGVVTLQADATETHVRCQLRLEDLRDLGTAVQRCRRLLDLDADPRAVSDFLGQDRALGPLVAANPGRRVPGHVDPAELAVRAVLGQQVSVAGARTLAGRLAAGYGKPLTIPVGGVTRTFPTADLLAAADPADLPVPRTRRRALLELTAALAANTVQLGPGVDRDQVERQLLGLPGIGPWTAAYIRMRALGDPDVFLPTDLGVRRALARLGCPTGPAAAAATARRWRPWRSYALAHLWGALDDPGATDPAPSP
jgi:AraC family transcriptional regulator, regulatory protein of adaptative response / DNA-3-methyladenine glycosylase II